MHSDPALRATRDPQVPGQDAVDGQDGPDRAGRGAERPTEPLTEGDTPAAVSDPSLPGPQGALSDRDRRILALEGRTFRYVGTKERAIREEIGLSKVAYYVRLNTLLDDPAALRAAPSVVHRLRARRTSEDGPSAADDTHRVA
ncbi:DUF3263 domain-containing protein [Brachybacterium sp. AOP43-C2-M15]|uniref:DUF3263 domain-containing protein n=1 Tax=Brachybacterium sp. AOP43-C2-M15 TaxID=3457661 RepID=UPI004033D227